jgi:F0F1-type ATP synthase membrane subunit c/vacuolar-type H+-ATPase subunit K
VPDAPDRENLTARLAALETQVEQSRADAERAQAQREELERLRAEGQARAQAAELPAPPPPASAPATPPQPTTRPVWPWFVAGAGLAATAAGLVVGGLATGAASDLRAQCVADPRTDGASSPLTVGNACATSVDLEARRRSIQTQALVGDVLWIGGAAITVTGLVLALVLPGEQPKSEQPPLTAACSFRSCQAALRLSF